MQANDLVHYLNQKYKTIDEIQGDYPDDRRPAMRKGSLPADIMDELRELLAAVGDQPLIVRSSSLLEDNFELSFAGMYESVFCPNQGTPDENLAALTQAITRVYASVYNPDVLLYRKQQRLPGLR